MPSLPMQLANQEPPMESISAASGDAFDGSAEPIIYMSENRMPVMMEFNSTIIYIVFAALILALLFILPGVRKTKLTSFLGLITLLSVGASILLALEGTHWMTARIQVTDIPYGSLTRETITGRLEVNVGLKSANVTLMGKLAGETLKSVDYNERFIWDTPDRMAQEHAKALKRGLPYPILTVTEFLGQDFDGFNWGRQLRQAGYYSSMALYTALASWCLTSVVMCVLPTYLPHMMQITGALIISSVWLYTSLLQTKTFTFHLVGNQVEFAFGYTIMATFGAGALSMFAGLLLLAIQMSHPHEQFTIMDSEQVVLDQKQQLSHQATMFEKPSPSSSRISTETTKTQVVIPIGDIEENFNNKKTSQ